MSQLLAPVPVAPKARPASPYVGLVPFREEDSDFFFGREAEKEIVTGNLRGTRLTIVYGSSGVGKTSLLRAGVVHDLRELVLAHAAGRPERAPFAVCTFRAWRDQPLAGLAESIRASVAEALGDSAVWPAPAGESFVESLRSWTRRVRTLLVVLDQFEDYFLYHPGEDGEGTFAVEFPRALNEPNLRVNFLLSIREDSWAKLDRFEGRIPRLFANYVRVEPLSRDAARRAIEGPIAAWNAGLPRGDEPYRIEPALAEKVLVAAAAGRLTLAAAGDAPRVEPVSPDAVEPPFLQLVMERLWQASVAADEHVLGVARLEELGGAQRIVANHLRDSLAILTGAEQAVASDVFRFLVTRLRTKIAHSAGDLAEWTKRPETEVVAVLDKLCSPECGRILRPVVPPAGAEEDRRYEIFHDVLAEAVLVWRRDFEAHAALELEREIAARRHRRLLVIAVGAALLAAAMVALAVYAFAQRNEAAKQQSKAETAATVALIEAGKAKRAEDKAIAAQEDAVASAEIAQQQQQQAEASEQEAQQSENDANTANAAAQQSAKDANAATALAESNRKRAVREADLARAAERRARAQAQHAKARALAEKARAMLLVDPVQSVRYALEAQSRERSALTEDALRASVVADRLRAVVPGGGGAVQAAMFSPDGSRILTLAARGGARLSRADGRLVRKLGSGRTAATTFSPDGSLAATAGTDGVRLWNAKDGSSVRTLSSAGTNPVLSTVAAVTVTFSGDGRRVAAGGAGGATVWSVGGTALAAFPHDGTVTSVTLDGGGGRLVTVATDSALRQQTRIFDVASGSLEHLLPERGITSATFSPDGSWVATTSNDKTARIWDVVTGDEHARMSSDGHLLHAEFSRDGKLLVVANEGGGALVSTMPDLRLQAQLLGPLNKVETASFSPDGQFVVIASLDRTARVFRSSDGFQFAMLTGNHGGVLDAHWSPDGASIVTAGEDGSARVWDPGTAPVLTLVGRHAAAVNSLRLSLDGRLAVTASADKTARIWRLSGGRGSIVLQHDGPVEDAVFSPDGSLVLTGSDDGTARLWRASAGTPLHVLTTGAPVTAVAFSPDGRTVATAGTDGTAALWRVGDGARLHVLSGDGQPLRAVAFSPDGTLVATAGDDQLVRIWSTVTGAQLHVLRGHTGAVATVAFSSDGRRLVTASADGTARLWSVRSGALIATLAGHTAPANDAEFSRDGTRIVTASTDTDARLWNGLTGKLLHVLRGHFGAVQTASFSPNGRWIVTGGPFTVGLWTTATGLFFSPTGAADPFLRGPTLAVNGVSFARDGMTIVAASADGSVRAYRCTVCGGLGELKQLAHERLRQSKPRSTTTKAH